MLKTMYRITYCKIIFVVKESNVSINGAARLHFEIGIFHPPMPPLFSGECPFLPRPLCGLVVLLQIGHRSTLFRNCPNRKYSEDIKNKTKWLITLYLYFFWYFSQATVSGFLIFNSNSLFMIANWRSRSARCSSFSQNSERVGS